MKISIITANFNREKTLARTIESVLNQTYDEIEYIIIDGKSTDSSIKIIEDYKEKFLKKGYEYKYISEKDTGIYNAMNKGIKIATGDIIGIIGSDDWYEANTLELVNKEFEKDKELKMVYGVLRTVKNNKFKKVMGDYESYGIGQHPTVFLKKELYDLYIYDESYKIAADTDLLLKLKKIKVKSKFIDKILTNFTEEGISSTDLLNVKLEDLKARYINGEISKFKKNKKYISLYFKYFKKKMIGGKE
ncbi:glycosyltransferase [Fusobacterium mortiferum]|uniref:glycosyltransferase family 2 protein n=1 Tax=Fusobacterium mortiferum TaxID=850 RepID=UPI001F4300D9|nr:glycosyltransferase family 2 protein [Fusobacterium mortiferum]MCF2626454.1 glycosyltransferase [Fusobacterium mortiferum]